MKGFFNSLNKTILLLNKITLMIIVLFYSIVLGITVTLVKGKTGYTEAYIPKYSHFNYNEDISTTYQIVHQYTYINDKLKESIGFNARLYLRPGRSASKREFMTKTLLDNGKMHYFTQYSGYNYSVIHNQIIPEHYESFPKKIFSSLEYYNVKGEKKYNTFEEEILTLTNIELQEYLSENNSEVINIEIVPFLKEDQYDFSFKVKFNPIEEDKNLTIHADLQSWAVTDDGEIYPFIGYYNFTNLTNDQIVDAAKKLPLRLGATYIYIKVLYYESFDNFESVSRTEEVLYKIHLPTPKI